MSKWFAVSAALVLCAMTTPASADWFRSARSLSRQVNPTLASTSGGGVVMHDEIYGGKYGMAPQGYPFYSGCCEPRSSCCRGLWAGFCGMRHAHRGCGCGVSSCGGCAAGKGGFVSYGGKGGGGCSSCGHAAPNCGCGNGCRRGLFHRFHAGHGCGSTCGVIDSGCGCGVSYGKGSTKYAPAAPVYEGMMEEATPAVPTPEPVSIQSADRRWSPVRIGSFN